MTKYFGVVYLTDGTIHLTKEHETQEECLEVLKRAYSKFSKRIKATTVIKRDMSNFKDGYIFGNPKSLNVVKK